MTLTKEEIEIIIEELIFRRGYYLMQKQTYNDIFDKDAKKITDIIKKLKEVLK